MQLGWAKAERLVMEGFVNRLLPPPITISASGPRGRAVADGGRPAMLEPPAGRSIGCHSEDSSD